MDILLTLALLLHTGDCLTTLDIKHHPEVHESNYVLGKDPSDLKIVSYFVATGYGYYKLRTKANREQKRFLDLSMILMGSANVIGNRQIGLRFNF